MKIFLTGDNHIGLKYSKYEHASELAAKRIDAFENMVKSANEEACDLFVIAGDLFEKNKNIAKRDIKKLIEMLAKFDGTVVVLPGNHDYFDEETKSSVWTEFSEVMQDYDNIMLLTEYRIYRVNCGDEEAILYPALCTSLHSAPGQNNLGWIKETEIEDDEAYHIGIAHGAVEGETIDKEGEYFVMTRSELEKIPVDAWLIGHTHVPFPRNLTEEFTLGNKIFNAGTHVQTDVNCNTEGLCFVIDIDKDKNVRAKKIASGNIRFYRKEITVSDGKMEEIIKRELADIDDNSFVDVILSGAVSLEEYESRRGIIEAQLERFLEYSYNDFDLRELITEKLIESEFPETSFSAKLLTALMEEPKEAQLAYELLKSLKEGK